MSANGIPERVRFQPERSSTNAAVGAFLRAKTHGQMLSVTYSFADLANVYNPASNPIQSRLAVIAGTFGDMLANFKPSYDLSGYRVIFDQMLNDPGPTPLLIPADAEDGVPVEIGEGVTILLAAPIVSGATGTLMIATFHPTSKGLVTATHAAVNQLNATAAQSGSTSTSTSSGSSGSSGGTGTGGGVGGGGAGPAGHNRY